MTYGSRQVSAGDYVQAGQMIGLVGSTGSSTACHVHFEVHINGGVSGPLGLAAGQRQLSLSLSMPEPVEGSPSPTIA